MQVFLVAIFSLSVKGLLVDRSVQNVPEDFERIQKRG